MLLGFVLVVALASPGLSDHSFFSHSSDSFGRPSSYHHEPQKSSYYTPSTTTTPKPYYKPKPKKTQQNCTVEDEVLEAEICTPDVRISCQDEQLMTSVVKEEQQCFQIQTLECSNEEVEMKTEVCSYVYESKETPQKVKVIEVEFEKKCTVNMVTVCQPQGYGGYHQSHYGPKCEEIEQNSCYNTPKVNESEKELRLVLPEPRKECSHKSISVPSVNCRNKSEQRCIYVPKITQEPVKVQKCVPVISGEKCDHIQLVLPKQVCKDLIVGDAHPVPKYPDHNPYH